MNPLSKLTAIHSFLRPFLFKEGKKQVSQASLLEEPFLVLLSSRQTEFPADEPVLALTDPVLGS